MRPKRNLTIHLRPTSQEIDLGSLALLALFGEKLPPPDPAQAERYWHAYSDNEILGRCVRLGCDDTISPTRHYHWAIYRAADGEFAVQEFWKPEVWTTTRYGSALRGAWGCPKL